MYLLRIHHRRRRGVRCITPKAIQLSGDTGGTSDSHKALVGLDLRAFVRYLTDRVRTDAYWDIWPGLPFRDDAPVGLTLRWRRGNLQRR